MVRVSSWTRHEKFWFRFENMEIKHPVSYAGDENRQKFHHQKQGIRDADQEYTEFDRKAARICL